MQKYQEFLPECLSQGIKHSGRNNYRLSTQKSTSNDRNSGKEKQREAGMSSKNMAKTGHFLISTQFVTKLEVRTFFCIVIMDIINK